MAMNSPDNTFEQRARALYREASQQLDPAIAGRLRAARRTALQAAAAPARKSHLLLPAGAFAVIAMATLMVWQPLQHGAGEPAQAIQQGQASTAEADGDLPPDADSADPNLYQNLDFYGWLASSDSSSQGVR
jgi:type II secretory pathway component PulM